MTETITVFICLILNAIFVAYEMAFVSIPRSQLKSLARSGNKDAQRLLNLRDHPERSLSIIQAGITLVSAVAAAVGGIGATENLAPYFVHRFGISEILSEILSVAIIVLPLTYINAVAGELVPKTLALRNPRRIILAGAKLLFFADRFFTPIVLILEKSTSMVLDTFFKKVREAELPATGSIDLDTLSPVHKRFMLNLAGIEKRRINDVLVPWSRVTAAKHTASIEEVTQIILHSGHTRIPVTKENQIIGILHSKEFLSMKETGQRHWLNIIRPVVIVRPTDSIFGVMRHLQETRNQMTIVLSPTQEKMGIVTLEDILEDIFGSIFDEDDDGKIRKIFAAKVRMRLYQITVAEEYRTKEFEIEI